MLSKDGKRLPNGELQLISMLHDESDAWPEIMEDVPEDDYIPAFQEIKKTALSAEPFADDPTLADEPDEEDEEVPCADEDVLEEHAHSLGSFTYRNRKRGKLPSTAKPVPKTPLPPVPMKLQVYDDSACATCTVDHCSTYCSRCKQPIKHKALEPFIPISILTSLKLSKRTEDEIVNRQLLRIVKKLATSSTCSCQKPSHNIAAMYHKCIHCESREYINHIESIDRK